MTSIANFFVEFGVSGLQAFDKIESKLQSVGKLATGLGVTFAGSVYGINKFLSGSIESSRAMMDFSNITGLATDSLQKWGEMAQRANSGISFSEVEQSIGNVNKMLNELRMGKGNITPFIKYNIVPTNDPFKLLEKVSYRLKTLHPAQQQDLMQQFGINNKMLDILQMTNAERNKLSRNAFLSPTQIATITALGNSLRGVKLDVINLKDQAIAKLAPYLTKVIKQFTDWMTLNKTKLIDTIQRLTKMVIYFVQAIGNAFAMVSRLGESLFGLKNGLTFATLAITGLMMAFKPLSLILFGIILLLDDIYVWSQGGDSLFGGFYEGIAKLIPIFKFIGGVAVGFFDTMSKGLNDIIMLCEKLGAILKPIWDFFKFIGGTVFDVNKALQTDKFGGLYLEPQKGNNMPNNDMNRFVAQSQNYQNNQTENNKTNNANFYINSTAPAPELANSIKNEFGNWVTRVDGRVGIPLDN